MIKRYLQVWAKSGDYSSRGTREEFWSYTLVNLFVLILLWRLDYFLDFTFDNGYGYLASGYSLFSIIPGLALNGRRLCDINKSLGAIFINLIPLVGNVIYLVWMLSPSKERAYYPLEKHAPEEQMGNRTASIILFFVGVRAFYSLFDLIFRKSTPIEAWGKFYSKMEIMLHYETAFNALLTLSLVFVLKEKKWKVVGFVCVGITVIIPWLYRL